MKIQSQYEERLYAGGRRPPLELMACSEWVLTILAPLIRLVGFTKLESTTVETGGRIENGLKVEKVATTVDNPFQTVQTSVAEHTAAILNIFGLKGCAIAMSDEEIRMLENDWLRVQEEIAKKTKITLNIETDPTDNLTGVADGKSN